MKFVMHEAFHFWNGALVHNADDTPSWLHEGGADFAALLGTMQMGAMDDSGMRAALGNALTQCRQALTHEGDGGMNDLRFLSMNVRYPCGIIIQWAASLNAEQTGHGDFFNIWTRVIAAARARDDQSFNLNDFYQAAGADPNAQHAPIYLLTTAHGPARWSELVTSLKTLGADISSAPTAESRRNALLMHLLQYTCTAGAYGFFTTGKITLEDNQTCGVLAGGPVMDSIEGADVMTMTSTAYASAQSRCAAGQSVRVVANGRQLEVPCHTALPNAPEAYVVNRWR